MYLSLELGPGNCGGRQAGQGQAHQLCLVMMMVMVMMMMMRDA
jgi:hypothetical protein